MSVLEQVRRLVGLPRETAPDATRRTRTVDDDTDGDDRERQKPPREHQDADEWQSPWGCGGF